ncbi:MAG: metallophosphatase family protein [Bacteroidales bacterium]|nr:metallophosphatase family protein [Bacteroidales bacterium]
MKKIGILSDTHSYLHPKLFEFFKDVDEIWHAGDFGSVETAEQLQQFKPLRGVYGNIDNAALHRSFPLFNIFEIESVKVILTHIGGSPRHYPAYVVETLRKEKPQIFVAGHSHILKITHDKQHNFLFINPGAAGLQGIHHRITFVRFAITGMTFHDMEIFETAKV